MATCPAPPRPPPRPLPGRGRRGWPGRPGRPDPHSGTRAAGPRVVVRSQFCPQGVHARWGGVRPAGAAVPSCGGRRNGPARGRAMHPSIHELSRRDRRRQIALTLARTTLSVGLIVVLYALAPVTFVSELDTLVRLGAVLAIVVVVVGAQIHSVLTATYPDAAGDRIRGDRDRRLHRALRDPLPQSLHRLPGQLHPAPQPGGRVLLHRHRPGHRRLRRHHAPRPTVTRRSSRCRCCSTSPSSPSSSASSPRRPRRRPPARRPPIRRSAPEPARSTRSGPRASGIGRTADGGPSS